VAIGTRRRYAAFAGAPPTVPDAAVAAATTAEGSPVWSPPGRPDYVLVTPDEFIGPARRLAAHRRTQGFDVLVAPLSEVYDAFDGGRRSEWAIRRLLEFAFAKWGSRFAMLFGDASEDPQNFLAESDRDWVPAMLIQGPVVGSSLGPELSASDFWYVSDLSRSVPPGPPCQNTPPDLYADMSVGRLPAGSLTQANAMVDRLIAYDTQDREGSWRSRVTLVPDDAYAYGSFSSGDVSPQYCYRSEEEVFEKLCNTLEGVLRDEAGYRDLDVDQFRLREKLLPLNRPLPGCFSVNSPEFSAVRSYMSTTVAPQFRTDLSQGALIVNWQGHGSAVVLAHETLFQSFGTAQDIDFVSNEGKPFFFLAFSCHVNQFTDRREKRLSDCLGENMVIGPQNPPRPSAGAIASYASTNFELLPSDYTGRNHLNVWLFRSMFVDPPHDPLLGERGARVLLGETMDLGHALMLANTFGLETRAVQTYCLLGDPATFLSTGAPRLYATANDQPVSSGARYQPGAPGDSVVFALDLVDESRIDDVQLSITGEGARPVAPDEAVFSPTYPDTANGGGGRRYQIQWNVRPEFKDADLTVSGRDRTGLTTSFTLLLRLEARLFVNGQLIGNGDPAPSSGNYQFVVSSPAQLEETDLSLTVDGQPVPGLVVAPAATDSSRRLWTLSWPGSYETGSHDAVVSFPGGAQRRTTFLTSSEPRVALRQVFVFPSPFAAPPVTFNFTLDSDRPTDVLIKIYSVSGQLVYQQVEPALAPGYHQVLWDGRDQRGDELANGAYLYTVIAADDRGLRAVERGRLARLR
jgi:hypothetical protein